MKGKKLKFDRDCGLSVVYKAIYQNPVTDAIEVKEVGWLDYAKSGIVILKVEGFEHRIECVDEMVISESPMDSFMSKFTLKIKKFDTSATLPHKFYGMRGSNVMINYTNELSGEADTSNSEDEGTV